MIALAVVSESTMSSSALVCISTVVFVFFWGGGVIFGAPAGACGGSQARGLIGSVTASLHHSHSNTRSEPRLCPTPQLTAMSDP